MKFMNLYALVATLLIILFTTLLPKITVYSKSDLASIKCGWPLHFIIQDLSHKDPPYPWKVNCGFYALEDPTNILWPKFVLDFALIYCFSYLFLAVTKNLLKTQSHPRP